METKKQERRFSLNGHFGWVVNLITIVSVAVAGSLWFSNQFHEQELFQNEVRNTMVDRWMGEDMYIWTQEAEDMNPDHTFPNPFEIIRERQERMKAGRGAMP